MRSFFILGCLGVLVLTGCPGGGPCASPEGLFPSPVASAAITDGGVLIDVSWQPAASTPASFYASPEVVSKASSVLLLDAGPTGAHLSTNSPSASRLEFELRYREGPTRQCAHPGMDDTFVLSVAFDASADGGFGSGTVLMRTELGAL